MEYDNMPHKNKKKWEFNNFLKRIIKNTEKSEHKIKII